MKPASETSQEKMLHSGKEREIRKSTKMESFFWEKCGREKWKRRAYLFLREALTPSVGSSIWDGQDNMLVRTVKKSKLFRLEIGEDRNWKKIILFGRHDFSQFSFKRKITSWCEWQDFSLAPLWLALVGPLSGGNVTKSCNLSLSDPSATSDKTSWPHKLTLSTFQKWNDDIHIHIHQIYAIHSQYQIFIICWCVSIYSTCPVHITTTNCH